MRPIRVILAEPQPIFMQGLVHELNNDGDSIELVAQTTNGRETLDAISEHQPDVVILADSLPEVSGEKVLDITQGIPAKVIFLTAEASQELVYRCMMKGACGYLVKWEINIGISAAIHQVMDGGIVMSPSGLKDFVEAVKQRSNVRIKSLLSAREVEVVDLMRRGRTNPEIADEMSVSVATVKSHCRHIFSKLGTSTQAATVGEALRRGIIR